MLERLSRRWTHRSRPWPHAQATSGCPYPGPPIVALLGPPAPALPLHSAALLPIRPEDTRPRLASAHELTSLPLPRLRGDRLPLELVWGLPVLGGPGQQRLPVLVRGSRAHRGGGGGPDGASKRAAAALHLPAGDGRAGAGGAQAQGGGGALHARGGRDLEGGGGGEAQGRGHGVGQGEDPERGPGAGCWRWRCPSPWTSGDARCWWPG